MLYHFKFSWLKSRPEDKLYRGTALFDTFNIALVLSQSSVLCSLYGYQVGDYIYIDLINRNRFYCIG